MSKALKSSSFVLPPFSLNAAYHQDENEALQALLAEIFINSEMQQRIQADARCLIESIRMNRRRFGGLDRFLQEFSLTTAEGIALMCLAEALLRIPDTATIDLLIRDKIGGADWDRHLGKTDDLFVNASTWALMLTGKVIADINPDASSSVLGRLTSRLSEPVVRQAMFQAMKILGRQFVLGRTIEEALSQSVQSEKKGILHSYDMLGEGARTAEDAERYFKSYEVAIAAIGQSSQGKGPFASSGISVKLSALHPRYEYSQRHVCVPTLTEKLLLLAQSCAKHNIALTIDAEEAHRLEMSLEIVQNILLEPSLKDWEGFGLAVQAYQKRCGAVIDRLAHMTQAAGRRLMVRLVKGAYWDSEIKYAQIHGLPGYPVFTRKAATDVSYIANAAKLLARRDVFYPMFGTHNAMTVATIMALAGDHQDGFEFQRLHGMAEGLYHALAENKGHTYRCRIYAPVGGHQDLLAYLVRRLLENGANVNFVNRLQDDKLPVEDLLVDPVALAKQWPSKPHPRIPLPRDLYGVRKNSVGVEFANSEVSAPLLRDIGQAAEKRYTAAFSLSPRIGAAVFDPSEPTRTLGTVAFATREEAETALATTFQAFLGWKGTGADTRAQCLERAADLMETHLAELMALCVREGGKTLPDSLAEVREAIDFCRYYAVEGRRLFAQSQVMLGPTGESNELLLEGRGVFLCISPWNFPLAIFIGQVAAALMAGNTVIAKPAGQTCLIAARATALLHAAGIPKEVLVFLPLSGALTEACILPDPRLSGVCLTGSTETAQAINRRLAARPGALIPFIAETGGLNAMIADSSALPEQIVDDVITSAFRSAGQRCSALRVLFVQEGIADKAIPMLRGACAELVLGDPLELSTDIGPVIDAKSKEVLEAHAQRMSIEGRLVAETPAPQKYNRSGHFFTPRAYEIDSLRQLPREVFGPILHIIRYKPEDLDKIVQDINATGYGLTFGLHTRIDHRARDLTRRIQAGNCYVNRSMIGAVVGVQPFGGQGLSGTGPKAGGPHYLARFATERTITVNTTASGGNTALVSLQEET